MISTIGLIHSRSGEFITPGSIYSNKTFIISTELSEILCRVISPVNTLIIEGVVGLTPLLSSSVNHGKRWGEILRFSKPKEEPSDNTSSDKLMTVYSGFANFFDSSCEES